MGENTKIEWADHSWSPWRGCTKVSPGCANCYAEELANRFGPTWGGWGKGAERIVAKNWSEPVKWDKASLAAWDAERGKGLPGTYPPRPTVFPSLCDWLDPEVPVETLARFLRLTYDTPNLTWLRLTKRPGLWEMRMAAALRILTFDHLSLFSWIEDCINGKPPANVWDGTSVEDQIRADERIPALLRIPAVGRFLSVEPLLGPVEVFSEQTGELLHVSGDEYNPGRIDWVIIGGESGPGARPCNVEWIRSLVRQCAAAGVPAFVKQVGSRARGRWADGALEIPPDNLWRLRIRHPKGGDPLEWPEDLRVREMPKGLR